jgi:hypothetical protein
VAARRPRVRSQTLEDDFRQSHLVVRGHITDVYVGEYWEPNQHLPVAYARVAVSEVLKGDPVWREPGYVEIQLGSTSEEIIQNLQSKLPEHDNVWFLLHIETLRPRTLGHRTEIAPFAYMGVNDLQGVVRNIDGDVAVIKPRWYKGNPTLSVDMFPRSLQGTRFDAFLARLRELTS